MPSPRRPRAAATRSWRPRRWAISASTTSAHVVHQPPVARGQRADGGRIVAQTGQAGEVLVQVAVGRPDHDRRAVHDVVAGEHAVACSSTSQHRWSEAWPGVCSARRVRCAGAGTGTRHGPPLAGTLVGLEALRRARSRRRGPRSPRPARRRPGAWSTWVWVTTMVRTGPSGAAAATMAAVWAASAGPGSTTTSSERPTR